MLIHNDSSSHAWVDFLRSTGSALVQKYLKATTLKSGPSFTMQQFHSRLITPANACKC